MQSLAQQKFPLETGGMLVGYIADDGTPVVTSIIGPGPGATHKRFKFVPDGAFQQSLLEMHYWETNGRETYIGDWHTHPKGSPSLSFLDRKTLARIALTPASDISNPIMVILGGGKESWQLGAARFNSIEKGLIFNKYHVNYISISYY